MHYFANYIVTGGQSRDLREMGDADNLMAAAQFRHFASHGRSNLAAYVGIDFIKNEERNVVLPGEGAFHGQHHAAHFPTTRNDAQRLGRFAWIGGEHEVHLLQPTGCRLG